MKAGDPGITLDLLIKALLVMGKSARDLGRVISIEPFTRVLNKIRGFKFQVSCLSNGNEA